MADQQRRLRRLERLREHHQQCAGRYEAEKEVKDRIEHERTVHLIQIMNRKKTEAQDEELESCATESLSESTQDLESDYIPSTSDSSEDEDVNEKFTFKKTSDKGLDTTSLTKNLTDVHEELTDRDNSDGDRNTDHNEGENVDEDTDENKDEDRSHKVTVKTCVKGEKRKWDKKHYCVYCKKPQSKMARHLMRKHSAQKEVAQALCYPLKSKKRRQIFEQLRRRGDYLHNINVLQKGRGEIITYRQPSENVEAENYLPCTMCFGFFVKGELWRHEKMCRKTVGEPEDKSKKKRRVQKAAAVLLPYRGESSQQCSKLISRMVVDKVSHEVKNDPLICEFGDRLLEKHGGDRSKDGHVSQKMRELGRFVLAAKSLNNKVKTLQDVLVPPNFALAVAAAKKASGYTNSKYRYQTPSLALKLGHSLKAACEIVIGQHVKTEDETAAGRVKSFLGLVAAEWDLYVSRRARSNLEEDRWNKKDMIPLTEDVMKLHQVLKSTEEEAKKELLEGPNPTAYKTLSECLLSQIILFNRRRQGEAAKLPLQTYRDRSKEELNEDVMQCLSKLEQDLSHEFTRLVIRGKRGRKVPVLLTKDMTKSLDLLIEKRSEDNDILDINEYVFARQNSQTHLRGSDCLRKYAAASGARRPETLTSTHLRKHVATLSQIMNLKDNELDQLAKFMGHDIRVHREYYRLTENTLQIAKMSKLLMAIELGTEVYKGKSLDELDLGLETALSANAGAVGVGQSSAEVSSEKSCEQDKDLDEEPNVLYQGPTVDEAEMTEATAFSKGKKCKRRSPKKMCQRRLIPAQDSDAFSKGKKRKRRSPKKMRKRCFEPPQDSDEEPVDLSQGPTAAPRTEKRAALSANAGAVGVGQSSAEVSSEKSCEQAKDLDEEPNVLYQGPTVDEAEMTEATAFSKGKKCKRRSPKKMYQRRLIPAQDSDALSKGKKRKRRSPKKMRKRCFEPPQDSDEEPVDLSQGPTAAPRTEKRAALSANAGAVGVGQSSAEVSSEKSCEQAKDLDEEPNVLYQGPTVDEAEMTEATAFSKGKKCKRRSPKKMCQRRLIPAQDSDEPRRTSTPKPQDALSKGKKCKRRSPKKMRKRCFEPPQDSDEEPVDLSQGPTAAPRTEKRGSDLLRAKACNRRPWSAGEKAAVWRQLGQFITLHRVPGKELCTKALEAEPVLRTRSWRDIKNQVYNSIVAQKRKLI